MELISVNAVLDRPPEIRHAPVFVFGRLVCQFEMVALFHFPSSEHRPAACLNWGPFKSDETLDSSMWINTRRDRHLFEKLKPHSGKNVIIEGTVEVVDWLISPLAIRFAERVPAIGRLLFLKPYRQLGHFGRYRAAVTPVTFFDLETRSQLFMASPEMETR